MPNYPLPGDVEDVELDRFAARVAILLERAGFPTLTGTDMVELRNYLGHFLYSSYRLDGQ